MLCSSRANIEKGPISLCRFEAIDAGEEYHRRVITLRGGYC